MNPYEYIDPATQEAIKRSAQTHNITNAVTFAAVMLFMAVVLLFLSRKQKKERQRQMSLLDNLLGDAPILLAGIKDKAWLTKRTLINLLVCGVCVLPIFVLLFLLSDANTSEFLQTMALADYWWVGVLYFLGLCIIAPVLGQPKTRAATSQIKVTKDGVFGFAYPSSLSVSGVLKGEKATTIHLRMDEILSADLDKNGQLVLVTPARRYAFFGMVNAFHLRECISSQLVSARTKTTAKVL